MQKKKYKKFLEFVVQLQTSSKLFLYLTSENLGQKGWELNVEPGSLANDPFAKVIKYMHKHKVYEIVQNSPFLVDYAGENELEPILKNFVRSQINGIYYVTLTKWHPKTKTEKIMDTLKIREAEKKQFFDYHAYPLQRNEDDPYNADDESEEFEDENCDTWTEQMDFLLITIVLSAFLILVFGLYKFGGNLLEIML